VNYYNEWDKKTAAWLQELINQRLIPDGHVDTRSICDVQPGDLNGYTQCHFFAGIGGWPLALQLAGWPPDRPVWTGSCPCQDYSSAGKGLGAKGERDLWPAWDALIEHHRPDTVFGEQVEAAIRHGWLDRVRANMERKDYAIGACVLGAHSSGTEELVELYDEFTGDLIWRGYVKTGPPHIRQRLFWVAQPQGGYGRTLLERGGETLPNISGTSEIVRLADAQGERRTSRRQWDTQPIVGDVCKDSWLGDSDSATQERLGLVSVPVESQQEAGRPGHATPWQGATTIPCADGKSRRVKPGIQLLAHGVPARVVRLRGYGNAIVPQVAAKFISAYMDFVVDNGE
jgi:DNA (cytosine-5)-methyltransferase 1